MMSQGNPQVKWHYVPFKEWLMTRQTFTTVIASVVMVFLAVLLSSVPIPFVARAPGQVTDFLADDFVQLDGVSTHPVSGSMKYPSMRVTSAEQRMSLVQALYTFVKKNQTLIPADAVYPVGQTSQQRAELRAAESAAMQQAAVVAGLKAAGEPVQSLPVIASVAVAGPSYLVLQPGDFIIAVDGVAVTTEAEVAAALRKHAIGDLMQFDVLRNNQQVSLSITTVASNDDPRIPRIGIELDGGYLHSATLNFASDTQLSSSAGLTLALTVYLQLSSDDLLASQRVAALGKITAEGSVGAVEGIRERYQAAVDAGATVLLLPAGNCSSLSAISPELQLIQVSELSDAIDSLRKLAVDPNDTRVPRC